MKHVSILIPDDQTNMSTIACIVGSLQVFEAANAYFEAAAILVRKGQRNRARSLIGLLRNLDKSKADEKLSLPLPLSPVIITVMSVGAACMAT